MNTVAQLARARIGGTRSVMLAFLLGCWGNACGSPPTSLDAARPSDATFDAAPMCREDAECEDGLACNGEERCVLGACVAGTPLRCDDDVSCTADFCSEELRQCVNRPSDADSDGHAAASCLDGRGVPLGDDCDDGSAAVHRGAMELCDAMGVDEDCDPTTRGGRDGDGDGFEDEACCNPAGGRDSCGDDCNDALRSARPGGTEVCNRIDDDCDGRIDEMVQVVVYRDADGDGRGVASDSLMACATASGYSPYDDDCDDTSALRSPVLFEACDGIDNDCDGTPDPEDTPESVSWYADEDGDGFGDRSAEVQSCTRPIGRWSLLGTDCDDATPSRHPAQAERCNGIDDDCNGAADFELAPGDLEDDDLDGSADARCVPRPALPDCDDADAASGPGEDEICDGRDNDCDARVDENVEATAFFRDEDGDGWGSEASGVVFGCGAVEGYVDLARDCDDADFERNPSALESCNGGDEDCDGTVDEEADALCTAVGDETVRCVAGRCRVVTDCPPGLADCDGAVANGCEAAVESDTANCSACGILCRATEPGTLPLCIAGSCGLACDDDRRDCNGTLGGAGDGCETLVGTDVDCNDCGDTCGATEMCDARTRTCVPRAGGCVAPLADCDMNGSCETDTLVSVTSCGLCGRRCEGLNASWTCTAGACRVTACAPSFLDCDLASTNGCESDARTDVDHCGACPNDCDAAPFTMATCGAGVCSAPTCRPGRYDCDGDITSPVGNGCESAVICPRVSWITTWGDVDDDSPLGMGDAVDVAVDASGQIYVLTSFRMTLEVSATSYTAPGDAGMVIALTPAGGFRWARLIKPDPIGDVKPERIAITSDGGVVVAGSGSGITLYVGGEVAGSLGGAVAGFVLRLAPATGDLVWTRIFPTGMTSVSGLGIGPSEVVIGGGFSSAGTDFGGGYVLTPAAMRDAYVARLNATTGATNFAFRLGGDPNEEIRALAVRASDGDIFVGGFYDGTGASFGGFPLAFGGARDGFVARCSMGGGVGSAIAINTPTFEEVRDVRVGGPYWYFSGFYSGSTTVGALSLSATDGSFVGAVNYVTQAIDWSQGFGGGGSSPFGIRRMSVDAMERVRVTFPASPTAASRFGGVAFSSIGSATHLAYLAGATGVVGRLDTFASSTTLVGNGIATMPDGSNVIVGAFAATGTIEGRPVTSAGSWDQLAFRTTVFP